MNRALVVAGLMLVSSGAEAKCGIPKLELVWSYPAADAVEVPTNAELWVQVPSPWLSGVAIRLDGQPLAYTPPLPSRGLIHVLPGPLQANHDFVLELDFAGSSYDAGASTKLEVRFRTGTGTATAPAAPQLGPHQATDPVEVLPGTCPEVHRAQTCLDTGPNVLHSWADRGPKPVAWLVGDDVFPARCEQPQLLKFIGRASGECVPVRAIGEGGLLGAGTEACLPNERAAPSDAGIAIQDASIKAKDGGAIAEPREDDGCHVGGSGGYAWVVALTALARAARRRRASS